MSDVLKALEALVGGPVFAVVQGTTRQGRLSRAGPGAVFSIPGGPDFMASAVERAERLTVGHYQAQFDELAALNEDDHGYDALRETLVETLVDELGLTPERAEQEVQTRLE